MKVNKIFILIMLSSSLFGYECKLLDQLNYSYPSKTIMSITVGANEVKESIDGDISVYKKTNIKNIFISSSLMAFDILEIDGKMVYMNHYSGNGRAYIKWICNK